MRGDVLDLIDSAVDDWETSEDAMRWAPAAPRRIVTSPIRWTREDQQRAIAAFGLSGAAVTEAFLGLGEAIGKLVRSMYESPAFRQLAELQVDAEPLPSPRERALWLRQHRNTGPAGPRLDGRRSR